MSYVPSSGEHEVTECLHAEELGDLKTRFERVINNSAIQDEICAE